MNPATNPAIDTLHALRDNWAAGGDMGRPDGFVVVREGVDGGVDGGGDDGEAYAVKIELWTDDCLMDLKKQDEAAARRRGEALAKKWAREHWPHTGYVDLGGAEGVYGATWAWDKATENELERTDPDEVVRLPAARANPASRPLDKDLYADVVAEAKERFDVWPSAYASGWVVKTYKARGGRYAGGDRKTRSGLTKWFGESWVDLSRPIHDEDGELVGYEPCGRKASDDPAAYPKCRPLAEAMRMSPSEVKDAVKRKRAAEAKAAKGRGGRGARAPVRVATYRANPDVTSTPTFRRWFGDSKVVAVPFPVERKPLSYKDDPEVSGFVRVEDLIATQRRVTKAGVEKYLDDLAGRVGRAGNAGRAEKIRVYETHDGRRYIADGHHRAVAAWAAGLEVLPAVVQLVRE